MKLLIKTKYQSKCEQSNFVRVMVWKKKNRFKREEEIEKDWEGEKRVRLAKQNIIKSESTS